MRPANLLAITVFVLFSSLVNAQTTATVSGKVEDATGAAVSGVNITVKSLETGVTRVATTDDAGHFRAIFLSVGQQEVKAEKEGFKSAVRSGINLEVGQEAVVNFQLQIGELLQEVRIVSEAPVVNTTTAQVSGLVTEREVKDLPLNGRSFDQLITLNSGAINYSSMKSANTTTSSGNTFSVSGRRTGDNLVLLNGVEYTGTSQLAVTPGGVSGELLGIDAIREFNVLTGAYSAEYGKRAGAQINVVTQSGSNQFHGSVFEFLRNSALDARNFFDQSTAGRRLPPFQRNQFGGSAGGPIRKDRMFIFGNYEGFRQHLGLSNLAVVPDDQVRQGLLPDANGVYSPALNLNRGMLPYFSLWPHANGPELLVNGQPSGVALSYNNPKQTIREDFGTIRTDYTISRKDTASLVYTLDDGDSLTPAANPLFGMGLRLRNQVISLHETHVVSPRVLNTLNVGFSRAAYNNDSVPLVPFSPDASFAIGAGPGGVTVGGGTTGGTITAAGSANNNVWNRRNLFTYNDAVQISRGIHQIGAGVWIQSLQHNDHTASRTQGQATFASIQTFLQGTVTNFQIVPNPTEVGWRSFLGAWYVEDTMKLPHNFSLRAGIRHEFSTGWNEVAGRASNYITDAQGVLLTDPRVGDSTYTKNNAKRLFGPRVGVAWDPSGRGKTAVRAGFGVYYTVIDNLAFLLNSLPPYNASVTFTGSVFNFLPITRGVQPPPACGPGVPSPCSIFAPQGVEPAAKTPTVNEWNLSVEQQISSNTAIRASYVGSYGYHGLLNVDPNSIPASACSSPTGCTAGGMGTARATVLQGTRYVPVQPTRPNPNVSAGFFWYTEGNSSYNAMQLELIRRLSRGLQFRANYTWAKNLDINSGLTGAQAQNQAQMVMDRNDVRRDWGPSALTPTHQASISWHYELPFGERVQPGSVVSRLIQGWQLNGITTLLSGFPFTPQIGANRSGDGNTRNPDRPSLNPLFSGPIVLNKQTQWFDPNAFVMPDAGTWGNLGRGTFRGPGLANVDLSLVKNIAVTERTSLQFRTEFFNAFNHTNLGTPNPIVFAGAGPNPSAGLITTTATLSREIQFALKLMY
jgi:Carboxypeptidase regulatory-like domain/TonB-dependent Receptor Plug Domain